MCFFLKARKLGDATKERRVRLFKMAQGLLQRDVRDLRQPRRFLVPFPARERLAGFGKVDGLPFAVGVYPQSQGAVLDEAAASELFGKHLSLLGVRIKAILLPA